LAGVLGLGLVKETLRHHPAAVKKYFQPLLNIADTLLRQSWITLFDTVNKII
jgi:hypothetical protein